jgi:hypothetical protein
MSVQVQNGVSKFLMRRFWLGLRSKAWGYGLCTAQDGVEELHDGAEQGAQDFVV